MQKRSGRFCGARHNAFNNCERKSIQRQLSKKPSEIVRKLSLTLDTFQKNDLLQDENSDGVTTPNRAIQFSLACYHSKSDMLLFEVDLDNPFTLAAGTDFFPRRAPE